MRIKDENEQMEKRDQMVFGGEIIIIIEQFSVENAAETRSRE